MIHVDNVTRRYGSLTAVDRVSFSVETNEIVGFVGPNGAGKTTVKLGGVFGDLRKDRCNVFATLDLQKLDALDASGRAERTIIVLVGDLKQTEQIGLMYVDFFQCGAKPSCQPVAVKQVQEKLHEHLERFELLNNRT